METLVQNKLCDLIERNSLSMDFFLDETYNCMLISIFEVLTLEMNDMEFKHRVKERFVKSQNKILTTKNLVYEITNCLLTEEESKQIYNYLYAYFTKKNKRVIYSENEKKLKLYDQGCKCNICKKHISIEESELDHIIPWTLVGDELGATNLQVLCQKCNRRKSKNSAYNLKMFLVNH